MAALSKTTGWLPSLESLLGDPAGASRAVQSPEEVRMHVMAWAAAAGLKVHRRAEVTHG